MRSLLLGLGCLFASTVPVVAADFVVIAHRGASGYLPEHTLAAASLAHAQGADYIEQDVVLSKDGVPIVLHDIHLETVTDVEQRFPNRHREDGRYYALDFTLQELRQLRVHERQNANGKPVFPTRYSGDGHFTIATLAEHISTIQELNRLTGKSIGLYPEIKSPAWHRANGYDISQIVLNVLRQFKLDAADANIFVQCFDFDELKRLRVELKAKMKLIQLIGENAWQEGPTDYQQLITEQGLRQVAEVAQGIGPWITHSFEINSDGHANVAVFIDIAHELELMIHPYTLRVDDLSQGMDVQELVEVLIKDLRADGVFTDQVPPVKALAFR